MKEAQTSTHKPMPQYDTDAIDTAESKLEQIRSDLDDLRNNEAVSGYGAEDYIDEAINSVDAAIVDMNDALEIEGDEVSEE